MSSSDRRIESSRANGARSRGPTTPEGKAISSQNSLKHGLFASTLVLDAEEDQDFQIMVDRLMEEHQPVGETETELVQCMAAARWRQLRAWGVEKCLWDGNIARQDPEEDPAVQASKAFDKLTKITLLGSIDRYETTNERRFHRALRLLTAQQKNRRKRERDAGAAGMGTLSTASPTATFRKNTFCENEPSPEIEQ